MGRALLITVLGVSFAVVFSTLSRQEGRGLFAKHQAVSEAGAIAHEAAESGFGVAAAAVRADLTARPAEADTRVNGEAFGTYTTATADLPYGAVSLRAVGAFKDARYLMEGEVVELFSTGAPLVVHAERAKLEVKDDASIAGRDHRPPSVAQPLRAGAGRSGPAIGFSSPSLRAEVMGDLSSDERGRLTGTAPDAHVALPRAAYALVESIRTSASTVLVSKLELEFTTLGTPTSPVVYYATDEVKLREGFKGYGILVADKKVVMEKNALWEGLIILRAEADGKSVVEMKDEARLVGSVVLLGEEDLREEPDSPGLPGGHFDLDIFEGGGAPLEREYHKHEWDDSYNLTYLDFLAGPDLGDSFQDFRSRMGPRPVRVEFENAFNASGLYAIHSGASSWTGISKDGFNQTMSLASLTTFRLSLSSLSELRGTYPGRVKDDAVERDRSFTVRFYDGASLVYAVSVYEHTKGMPRDGLSVPPPGMSTEEVEAYGEFEVKVTGDAQLLYSEEAVGRLGRVLPRVRSGGRVQTFVTRSVPLAP